MDTPHGVPHQFNTCVLDVDSDVTGYGKHNRIAVFYSRQDQTIEAREDLIGLPLSTKLQRRKVMMGWQRMHPKGTKLTHVSSLEEPAHGEFPASIWHICKINRH